MADAALGTRHLKILAASLQQLFDRAPTLVVLLGGPDHVIEYANPASEALIGHGCVIGLPVREVAPPMLEASFIHRLDQVRLSGETWFAEEAPLRTGADEPAGVAYYDMILQPVLDHAGEVSGVFGQAADATARVRAEHSLRDSEARLDLATRAAELGVWDWRLDTGELVFSPRAREIWGFPATGPVTLEMMGASVRPEDITGIRATYFRALDPQRRDTSPYQYGVMLGGGEMRWVRAHGEAVFEEKDGEVRAVRYVGTMEDVTAARQREEALRSSEDRLRLALDAGRLAPWALDASGKVVVTPEFNRLLNLPVGARPTLTELQARYYPGEVERVEGIVQAALARTERYIEFEYRHLWPDDTPRWLLVRAELVRAPSGEYQGLAGVIMDITERRESEERLKLLAREVDHRANNLLAVVQGAIALSHADTAAELKQALLGRVSALAKAHQLLSSSRWVGADLKRLIREEMEAYCEERPDCVDIQGESVPLSPAVAQGLAMALHELATNAVKHGAWSNNRGRVSIRWTGGDRGEPLALVWSEQGGPLVRKPTRSRLGMQVITRSVTGSLGGQAELDWRPGGLVCRITVRPPETGHEAAALSA